MTRYMGGHMVEFTMTKYKKNVFLNCLCGNTVLNCQKSDTEGLI